ncbi:hypothetical protein QBC44DRAFT_367354 [Cladorrhinum sp. PSN332]|nr:hypothetical protein QBC44DRAFT_367354 [Cladorrhinum sp. PSN332]
MQCRTELDTPPFNPAVIKRYLEMLVAIGGLWEIHGRGCHRLGCQENSAIWWCSRVDPALFPWIGANANDIYDMARRVMNTCWNDTSGGGLYMNGYQYFAANHPRAAGTRVFLGYANCADSVTRHPHDYYAKYDAKNGGAW